MSRNTNTNINDTLSGINRSSGTITPFAKALTTIRAIDDHRETLDGHFATWRVNRTYLTVVSQTNGCLPLFVDSKGYVQTEIAPGEVDRDVQLAALALQAARSDDEATRREAADVLLEDCGLKDTLALVEGVPPAPGADHISRIGGLVRGLIAPVTALVPHY